jgi:hypothetical protein
MHGKLVTHFVILAIPLPIGERGGANTNLT